MLERLNKECYKTKVILDLEAFQNYIDDFLNTEVFPSDIDNCWAMEELKETYFELQKIINYHKEYGYVFLLETSNKPNDIQRYRVGFNKSMWAYNSWIIDIIEE